MSNSRPKEVTQELERQAWNLRMDCWTQEHIAEHLGLSQEVVSRMLKRQAEKLAKAFQEEIAQVRGEQTGQLMRIAEAAFRAFQACQQDTPLSSEQGEDTGKGEEGAIQEEEGHE